MGGVQNTGVAGSVLARQQVQMSGRAAEARAHGKQRQERGRERHTRESVGSSAESKYPVPSISARDRARNLLRL